MVTPSGLRSSEPVPPSSASGSAPNSAASVVIMIGRNRSSAALMMDSRGRQAFVALGIEREVDHHDRVLLDDAHQQHDADQRDHREVVAEQHQREQRADAGRGQRRENCQRVDEALVQHAEHDVDRDRRRRGSATARWPATARTPRRRPNSCRSPRSACRCRVCAALIAATASDSAAPGRQIEADRHRRELLLMRDRQAAPRSARSAQRRRAAPAALPVTAFGADAGVGVGGALRGVADGRRGAGRGGVAGDIDLRQRRGVLPGSAAALRG